LAIRFEPFLLKFGNHILNFKTYFEKKYEYIYTSSMYDTRFVELNNIKNKCRD
jgi:hypothetical protein